MLQDARNNWQFDIFGFDEECKGKGLSVLGFHLYKQAGLITDFKLDEVKLIHFLQKAESGYSSANPYHNRLVPLLLQSAPLPLSTTFLSFFVSFFLSFFLSVFLSLFLSFCLSFLSLAQAQTREQRLVFRRYTCTVFCQSLASHAALRPSS